MASNTTLAMKPWTWLRGLTGVFRRAAVVGITIGVKVKQKSTVSWVECRVFWEQGNPCNCMAMWNWSPQFRLVLLGLDACNVTCIYQPPPPTYTILLVCRDLHLPNSPFTLIRVFSSLSFPFLPFLLVWFPRKWLITKHDILMVIINFSIRSSTFWKVKRWKKREGE